MSFDFEFYKKAMRALGMAVAVVVTAISALSAYAALLIHFPVFGLGLTALVSLSLVFGFIAKRGKRMRCPAEREPLPPRRAAVNTRISAGKMSMIMGVGFYPDGRPAEVFVSDVKSGSDADSMARDAAICLSICLQYGIPIAEISKSLTKNADGSPSSILGELVRELAEGELTK